ncbi:hypothetical protein ACUTAH_02650 [Metapseudomonas furukawaii]|uniref:hypothetical protein n=1 Tax=Metapseudomonas furukawaii TaxID=1149133 RepID=UPI004045C3B2
MTLAQERAATRAGITAARTSTLRRDLNSLETQRRQIRELVTLERRGLRPATKGRGTWDPNKPTIGGGGGIASPLTEKTKTLGEATVPDRDLYGESLLFTSDGLFTLSIASIKTLRFLDAEERDVQLNLAAPVTEGP